MEFAEKVRSNPLVLAVGAARATTPIENGVLSDITTDGSVFPVTVDKIPPQNVGIVAAPGIVIQDKLVVEQVAPPATAVAMLVADNEKALGVLLWPLDCRTPNLHIPASLRMQAV